MTAQAAILSLVDGIEGYRLDDFAGSHYVRRAVRVMPPRGPAVSSWLYVFNGLVGDGARIPSGDYAADVMRQRQCQPLRAPRCR
jgi:gamma-glutamylcyclotransferase (GGCT)/AIG2-like uncharacterized protein YtfP